MPRASSLTGFARLLASVLYSDPWVRSSMVEQEPFKLEVLGSSPSGPTIDRDINKIKSSSCDIIFYNMTLWGGHRVFWKVRDKSI